MADNTLVSWRTRDNIDVLMARGTPRAYTKYPSGTFWLQLRSGRELTVCAKPPRTAGASYQWDVVIKELPSATVAELEHWMENGRAR